ncbi:MAG: M20/M25/M40 family metallo-hydrolase [Myxococcaceae bacterium]|nr:M20/M25/M40 family metallo-hydrolase [Myxococcaceae bacterium]MCA3013112.1 M20/M25/M40 family metallo-hydrolase [Myxococcaceae bacterium]
MTTLLLTLMLAADKGGQAQITSEALLGHVRFLASDALEGRGPATRGDALTQQYLATQFETLGLAPAGTQRYLQPFDLVGVTGHPAGLTFKRGNDTLVTPFHTDMIAVSGHQLPRSAIDKAEVVFVGYGIVAPEYGWNDFLGVDVKGKVLLVMNNDPEDDAGLFAGKTRLWYGRWDYKYEQAMKQGAAGCLIIHTTPSAGYPWQVVQTSWTGEQFDLPAAAPSSLQLKGWLTEEASRKLVAMAGKDLDALRALAQTREFRAVPLGVSMSASFSNEVASKSTANVLGVLPGSDPRLADEWLVITAHHDHLGVKAGGKKGEDVIYNGAVDNASGVAALLTLAKALSTAPKAPRRSVLFAAVAAEEQGLLGSQYLVEHPPVPPGRMAANVNIDGLNIWGRTKDVSVIGFGKSSIDAVLASLARAQGREVKPDALSDRGFFYRSDQFNFAKAGVPATYFSSGHAFVDRPENWGREQRERWEATRYHQPSDEVDASWDLAGAVEDVKLVYQLVVKLGDAPVMPTWTRGDEFEAARLASFRALLPAPARGSAGK